MFAKRNYVLGLFAVLSIVHVSGPCCLAQDLLDDDIVFSGLTLQLSPYAQMSSQFNDVISMTTGPMGTFVTTQEGGLFSLASPREDTTNRLDEVIDFATAIRTATGRSMSGNSGQKGLQSVAFHPDFQNQDEPGYGKLYTTYLGELPSNPSSTFYLGESVRGNRVDGDGVLAEWNVNPETMQLDTDSYRELFRVKMPVYDHPIKQARFNPYAQSGDDDYGLLYVTHGDANSKPSTADDPQNLDNVMGKMLRIDPLATDDHPYGIPESNLR